MWSHMDVTHIFDIFLVLIYTTITNIYILKQKCHFPWFCDLSKKLTCPFIEISLYIAPIIYNRRKMSKFSDKLNFTMIIHNPVYIFFFVLFLIAYTLFFLYTKHIWKKVQLEKFTKYFNSYECYKYVQHNTILDKYFFHFLILIKAPVYSARLSFHV